MSFKKNNYEIIPIYNLVIFFLVLIIFYIYNLDSDPSIIKRYGDIPDEGYWVHEARINSIFHLNTLNELKMASFGAPLFNFLTQISYKFLGVSFFSSRLVSIISLWIIVILLFGILNKRIGSKKAIIYSLLFGLTHEMIIYGKLAMPLMLQNLFFLLSVFLFDFKTKSEMKHFLVGVSVGFGILSKISGYYFFFVFCIIYLILFIRKRNNFSQTILYVSGCLVVVAPHLKNLFFDNFNEFQFMMSNIADGGFLSNIIGNESDGNFFKNISINQLTFFLQISLFKSPGTIFILIGILILSCFNFLAQENNENFRSLKEICLIWIFVNIFFLTINNQVHLDRRTVGLFIPFYLLFIALIELKSINHIKFKFNSSKIFILFTLTIIIITYYLSGLFGAAGRNYLNTEEKLFFFDTSNKVRFLIILPIVSVISYLLFAIQVTKLKQFFIISFFLVNLILNSFLYIWPSYTIRDSSKNIINKIKLSEAKYLYGSNSYLYSIENKLIPIWNFNSKLNLQLIKNVKNDEIIFVSEDQKSDKDYLFYDSIIFNTLTNKYKKKIYFYSN